MTISNNIASIQANQTLLDNSANNVANVNTEGFTPKDGRIVGAAGGTPTAELSSGGNNGSSASQTDLAKEMTDQMTVQRTVEANVNAIRTQNEMFGSLLDIKV